MFRDLLREINCVFAIVLNLLPNNLATLSGFLNEIVSLVILPNWLV